MPKQAPAAPAPRATEPTLLLEKPPAQIPGIRPHFDLTPNILQTIAEVLASGQATNNGPHLRAFEASLAEYLGVSETVAVSNGSDALQLALMAMRLPPGAIILPAYTYIATLNAIIHSGHTPVFCDAATHDFTLDPNHLHELIATTPNLRCVIPVNVFGIPPDLATIRALCDRAGLKLLYDNAHGFGSETNGLPCAPEPDAQTFSFHATKTLPAVEGGLVIAQDPSITAAVKRLRNHGLGATCAESGPGINSKMDELRAIVGANSLRHFPEALARRRTYGHRLLKTFEQHPDVYRTQQIPKGVETNFQNLGVCCHPVTPLDLDTVLRLFRDRGLGVRSYFDPPLYKLPGYDLNGPLPVTESIWRTLVSFPIHSRMTEPVLQQIEQAIVEVASLLRCGL